jgi:translation initiation factor 2 beta subunit (eIF-2beta)/eIF-5
LLKKGNRWKWTPELNRTFETLREKFANTIHLVQPNENLPYIIHTDASSKAIGAVLMQKNAEGEVSIVSTASRVMKPAEKRYTTCEQELLAVVFALEKFRLQIYGNKIFLNTDNKALSFLQRCAITSSRVARWSIAIQEYDLEIQHIKGAENHLADVLSRNPTGLDSNEIQELSKPNTIMINRIELDIDRTILRNLKQLADAHRKDPGLRIAWEKANNSTDHKYKSVRDVLFKKDGREEIWTAMLPECFEMPIIQYVHRSLGHTGVDKCIWEIKRSFHLKNIGRKVRKFDASCDTCQRVKYPNRSLDIEERSHIPKQPGELCSIYFYGPLPTGTGGVKYILVCMDVFSKYVKLYPLKAATTKSSLNKLINHYFIEVVKPQVILSDNRTQFQSPVWKATMNKNSVGVRYSAIRHPQSNPSERCMREISKFCRIYCHANHRKWVRTGAAHRILAE